MILNRYNNKVQSNLVNMDTEGTIESVCIHGVSALSGLNLEKKCKGILSQGTKQTVRKHEVPILSWCSQSWVGL